jgi:hypothetical protein
MAFTTIQRRIYNRVEARGSATITTTHGYLGDGTATAHGFDERIAAEDLVGDGVLRIVKRATEHVNDLEDGSRMRYTRVTYVLES